MPEEKLRRFAKLSGAASSESCDNALVRHDSTSRFRVIWKVACLAAGLALAAIPGCRSAAEPPAPSATPNPWNVLVITVDTLRADHLRTYADKGVETPAVSRLASEGVRFASAYTPVPLTLPAHTSIFTGMLPYHHGVRDNGGFYVNPQQLTLARVLKEHGYRTAAFVSAFVLDSRWGLAGGFDDYYDNFTVSFRDLSAMGRVQRPGGETWGAARSWLDRHAGERFFVWLHLFDPHTPYAPPEPFRTTFREHPYDGEIAYADSIVGQAIDYLQNRQALDHTLVLFLSDHGEGLGDHGEDEHGLLAYDSTLHVPWIIRLPDRARAGTVVTEPVSLVDLLPTTLGLLGLPEPHNLDGADLAPAVRLGTAIPNRVLYAETYYPRLQFNWSEVVTLRRGEFKLLRSPSDELYDYRADTGEARNLVKERPDVVDSLSRLLQQLTQGAAAPTASAVDQEAMRRLGSLGYTSGGSGNDSSAPGSRVSPAAETETYRQLTRARQWLEEGHSQKGIDLLQGIVTREPELAPARRLLRDYWIDRNEPQRGVAWFRAAAAAHAGSASLLVDLAALERAAGETAQAVRDAERALAITPQSIDAMIVAGEALRDSGAVEAAIQMFRRASERTTDPVPAMRLAETLIRSTRLDEARGELDKVLARDPRATGAHYMLAQIAEARQDGVTAEREYRNEIAVSPWEYRARFNLALLLGQRGRQEEQINLLRTIPDVAPRFGDVYFFLAKALLDSGDRSRLPEAISMAERGLQTAPDSASAPLGHYVLADVYRLQGRAADAQREVQLGSELERRLATRTRPSQPK